MFDTENYHIHNNWHCTTNHCISFLILVIKNIKDKPKREAAEKQRLKEKFEAEQRIKDVFGFEKTKTIDYFFSIDEIHKKMRIDDSIYNYSDLINFELTENGEKINTQQSGTVGRAIVGGALFGVAGAVIGASTAPTKNITTINNMYINMYMANGDLKKLYICGRVDKSGSEYVQARNKAERILAVLYSIKNSNNQ